MRHPRTLALAAAAVVALISPLAVSSGAAASEPEAERLVRGLQGGSGSTIGPDGALYVTESAAGKVTRIDPRTGDRSTYARNLPALLPAIGIGGAMDVAFHGDTAYVLVTLVGADVGGSDIAGLYRIDGKNRWTVVADIGQWSMDHPPATDFFVPTGVYYAMEAFRGGFLVSDGHHNRVLWVSRDGDITEVRAFDNIVPTGLEVDDGRIFLAQAGPVPHDAADGKVVSFRLSSSSVRDVASGAPLLVDVERGSGGTLYALAQGEFGGGPEGSPAAPDTGSLVRADGQDLEVVVDGLDRPTSLEVKGDTAWVVTLDGEVWTIHGLRSHHDD
jgi:sugar lactone lactonase YvrE